MSWVNGRQLASASDGTSTYSYIYDAAGSRIMKNVGTVNHLYFYVNGMLLMEYRYNAMGDTTDVLQYFYDANGKPHAMAYNGTVYLYVTNLQGDIVALLGLDGTVSGYEYDPYGNVIASYGDIAAINPLRYRGYYYDSETGLYYVSSRYYDPEIGRWINADDTAYLGADGTPLSYNLFAYCVNNPVNRTDINGNWSGWATAGVLAGTALCVAAVTVLTCGIGTATLAGAVAVGAAKGALIGAAVGTATGAGIGYAATGTLDGAATGAAIGFGAGSILGTIAGGTSAGLKYGTFSTKASLEDHFLKHGSEFGDMYSSAKEYADGAKYVIKNGTYIPEKNAYIRFLGNQGKANYAFVGLKSGGRVSTYHVRSVGKMIRDGISLFAK